MFVNRLLMIGTWGFFGLVSACAADPCEDQVWREEGTHILEGSEGLKLEISLNDDDEVAIKLIHDGITSVHVATGASKYHRWFFDWDENREVLWFYSGDVGTYAFAWNELESVFERHSAVKLKAERYPIPKCFLSQLPEAIRKALLSE